MHPGVDKDVVVVVIIVVFVCLLTFAVAYRENNGQPPWASA